MAVLSKNIPGVYVEEISKSPLAIKPVETAVPAFIGYTEKADDITPGDLILHAKRIMSMAEYEKYFGLPQSETNIKVEVRQTTSRNRVTSDKITATLSESERSKHLMYYALQMFFTNGGGPCYIISAGLYKANPGAPLVGKDLKNALDVLDKEDEPTLIVFPEAQNLAISDFRDLHDEALKRCATLGDRFVIMDIHGDTVSLSDPDADFASALTNFRNRGIGNKNLKYGAAYAPNIETMLDYAYNKSQTDVTITRNGAVGKPIKLVTLKNRDKRVYELSKAAIRDMACKMPPASTIAGIFAAVDKSRGVYKAPANISMKLVTKPTILLSNEQQAVMKVNITAGKSVNALRIFQGRGTLVWGARTLAGYDSEWRYISVCRFCIFIEESCKKATKQFVFEPNDANTWTKVRAMIENFLILQWRAGALQGAKPDEAFYVRVGLNKTMTAQDNLDGRMIIEIGMAVVRPAEFIIIRYSQKIQSA